MKQSSYEQRSKAWVWYVCGVMMVATVINYMDRMTLNLLADEVQREFSLNEYQYGKMELGFGLAFASGSLFFGYLIDRVGVFWIYPMVLAGWSTVGFLSGLTQGYGELLCLRVLLGFFESAHFPCALKVVQILMEARDRPLANSLLQSGSALGAILAPQAIKLLLSDTPQGWRQPFMIIGASGGAWVLFWLLSIRPRDLPVVPHAQIALGPSFFKLVLSARFAAMLIVSLCINTTWQFFRVWLPKFLCDARGYETADMLNFVTFYYLAAYLGSLGAGFASSQLARHGWSPFAARVSVFAGCCVLTLFTIVAAVLPAEPLLLASLLLVAAGSLGLYTACYSLTQDISREHQGKISGLISTITWLTTAPIHTSFGAYLDRTREFDVPVAVAGCLPMVSLAALLWLWPPNTRIRQ